MRQLWQSLRTALHTDGRMLVRFLLISLALLLFAKIGSEIVEGDTLAFDRAVMTALRRPGDLATPIGPHWIGAVMRDLTALGGVVGLTMLTAIVAGYLIAARKAATALFLVAATVGGSLLNNVLKGIFDRPRPEVVAHLVDVSTTSFPSGHAMNSAIVFLTLGGLLAGTHQNRAERIYIMTMAILLALLIGISRVYLGVHYPTDVLAGWTVGAAWAALCTFTARRLRTRRAIEPAED